MIDQPIRNRREMAVLFADSPAHLRILSAFASIQPDLGEEEVNVTNNWKIGIAYAILQRKHPNHSVIL